MSPERDFGQATFKVKGADHWFTLLTCDFDHYDEVKARLDGLARAANCQMAIKALDAVGWVIEQWGPLGSDGVFGWSRPSGTL